MINRELTQREREILGMIRPTTFHDIVDAVRRDVEQSRYNAKRELRSLHNGTIHEIINDVTNGNMKKTDEGDKINNISKNACEALV